MNSELPATRNPLWIIVVGMACFCAVVVAVMAQSADTERSAQLAPPASIPIVASTNSASPDT